MAVMPMFCRSGVATGHGNSPPTTYKSRDVCYTRVHVECRPASMNHRECYRILGAEPGCTWEQLRTAYRRQVQIWHPDRYQQRPEQAAGSAQRMLKVNAAFEQLASYFERHGELPLKPSRARSARGPRPPDDDYAWRRTRPTAHGRSIGIWLVLLGVAALVYYASRPSEAPLDTAKPPLATHVPANGGTALHPPKHYGPPFGFGDKPGDVFAAQGVPTGTAGDIWYYGRSEVHFERGAVVKWFSSPDYPLNTRATSSSILGDTHVDKPGKK